MWDGCWGRGEGGESGGGGSYKGGGAPQLRRQTGGGHLHCYGLWAADAKCSPTTFPRAGEWAGRAAARPSCCRKVCQKVPTCSKSGMRACVEVHLHSEAGRSERKEGVGGRGGGEEESGGTLMVAHPSTSVDTMFNHRKPFMHVVDALVLTVKHTQQTHTHTHTHATERSTHGWAGGRG